jgi:predicted Zn finger-like uncharacterized protein
MFTVCPKCALTLVVTAADLRVAQGYVRCGRCSSVFNALARLTEERQAEAPGEAVQTPRAPTDLPAPAPSQPPPAQAQPRGAPPQAATTAAPGTTPSPATTGTEAEDVIPDDDLEFHPDRADVSALFIEPLPDPEWTAATGSFKAMVAANQPAQEHRDTQDDEVEIDAAYLASLLHDPVAPGEPQTESVASHARASPKKPRAASPGPPEPTQGAASASPAAARATRRKRAAPAKPPARHGAPRIRPTLEAGVKPASVPAPIPTPTATDDLMEDDPAADAGDGRRARLQPYLWHAAIACAVLVLLMQIVHHYRDELAVSARLNRPLSALYASLGMPLVPRWDLHAYDVRQLGASVDPGGSGIITVRASIKNAAQQPQPLPLLRVTLQDRFGNRIASREVAPRSYLPHGLPASALLAGGQRIDAEMGFVDPGANAVGFEIDACLPARGGVACANDASAR